MDDDETRATIAEMLASGLETEVWPRAGTSEEVNEIVARLQVGDGRNTTGDEIGGLVELTPNEKIGVVRGRPLSAPHGAAHGFGGTSVGVVSFQQFANRRQSVVDVSKHLDGITATTL